MNWGKAVRFLNGLPGIILAAIAALAAFQAYVSQREQLAVERAAWQTTRDSLRNVIVAEQVAAEARDRQAQARLATATRTAVAAGAAFASTSAALHAIVDTNATAKVALDSLEAQHGRQVLSLEQALAIEKERVADRDAQLAKLRGNLATAITRADNFERQAHPGAIKRILDSPVTHLVAFGLGYVAGAK